MDDDDIPDVDSILKWCSSLVRKDELSGTLSLSHFTVEEFLEDDQLLETPELRYFHMKSDPSEHILAKVCLTYLNFDQFSRMPSEQNMSEDLQFFKYASIYWLAHAERGNIDEDEVLFELICRLFNPVKSLNFILWLEKYWLKHERVLVPKTAPTLHLVRLIAVSIVAILSLPRQRFYLKLCHLHIF
jgi:lysyl-tRNA synthetase class I